MWWNKKLTPEQRINKKVNSLLNLMHNDSEVELTALEKIEVVKQFKERFKTELNNDVDTMFLQAESLSKDGTAIRIKIQKDL